MLRAQRSIYDVTPAVSKSQLESSVLQLASAKTPVSSASCESGLEGKVGALAYCDVTARGVRRGARLKSPVCPGCR